MKNIINYYYGLVIDKIIKKEQKYILTNGSIEYEFIPCYYDIKKVLECVIVLNSSKKYYHEIIMNNKKEFITVYNNIPYVLIKKHINNNSKIMISDVVNFIVPILNIENKYKTYWSELWKRKIDYYEYQVIELSAKYKIIRDSFNYFVGLSETAIKLLDYVNYNKVYYSVSHYRVDVNDSFSEFCNPLNFIIDVRTRDISEYLKSMYFTGTNDLLEEFDKIVTYFKYTRDEMLVLFARLLYPTYYFDQYDNIVREEDNELKINDYIKKSPMYETFLKQIYMKYQEKYQLPIIDWFN